MDQNYEDEDYEQAMEDPIPPFEYESKEEVKINKLVHSILIESTKSKPMIPNCFTKRVCESVGLQSNDEIFFNILGTIAGYSLNNAVSEIKSSMKANKSKKERVLTTAEVKKTLEEKDVYLCANKVIPEMGISESKEAIYEAAEQE